MKKLNKFTSYELYSYGDYENVNVQYIQFDADLKSHVILENTTLEKLYDEWVNTFDQHHIFVALIRWFYVNEDGKLIICLNGKFGSLQFERG